MFTALYRGARLGALLATDAAALVVLTIVGRRPAFAVPWARFGSWVQSSPPGDVLVALLRWVGLVGVGWVTATTLLYVAAAASRIPAATRALRWSTLPVVRRVVDATFAMSVVTGLVVAPVAAAARPADSSAVTEVRDGRTPGIAALPADGAAAPPAVAPSPPPAPQGPAVDAIVLVAGDDLWDVAARALAARTGRPRAAIGDAEVARYWVRLCDTNLMYLQSGDPDLVYPGERIVLPPLD